MKWAVAAAMAVLTVSVIAGGLIYLRLDHHDRAVRQHALDAADALVHSGEGQYEFEMAKSAVEHDCERVGDGRCVLAPLLSAYAVAGKTTRLGFKVGEQGQATAVICRVDAIAEINDKKLSLPTTCSKAMDILNADRTRLTAHKLGMPIA